MEIPQTERGFLKLVERLQEEGISLVAAVYRIIDALSPVQLAEDGIRLACQKGCSFCCHQLVTCTEIEWKEIAESLGSQKIRGGTKRRFLRARQTWREYYHQHKANLAANPLGAWRDYRGIPCVFLDPHEQKCLIYAVRPIDCRTMTSLAQCQNWEQKEVVRMRYLWEIWGNNLILKEQERLSGLGATTPLPHWLCLLDL